MLCLPYLLGLGAGQSLRPENNRMRALIDGFSTSIYKYFLLNFFIRKKRRFDAATFQNETDKWLKRLRSAGRIKDCLTLSPLNRGNC
jgi:hypothetical protein